MKNAVMNHQSLITSLSNLTARPAYPPEKIARLMKNLNLNERSLAIILNVTPFTVRLWLTGKAAPCNPSSRLLQLLELDTGMVSRIAAGASH